MKSQTLLASVLVALTACGGSAPVLLSPALPSDGVEHVAAPAVAAPATADADPWVGRADLIKTPAAQPPAKVELPKIERFTLPNGLSVMVVKSDRLPVVSMQLAVRAGRGNEPQSRLGVAELTADMLVKGSKHHDANALAKEVDFVGASMSADASFEATIVQCSALSKNFDTCLSLMPEVVETPTFPATELDKTRQQLITGIRQRRDDGAQLAADNVQNLLWGDGHVRGWVLAEADAAAITRDDLVAWHAAWFAPNNSLLTIAGDVDAAKIKAQLTKAFAGWKSHSIAPLPTYKAPGLSGVRIRIVDKPGQTQTHIRVGQFGIRHDDPRFFESLVWNYVLGGGAFSSRLMKVVRSEGGKTYGASSAFDRNIERGSFVASTFTRNSEAVATTKLLLGEIAKMHNTGPTDTEVSDAVANIAGAYVLKFQTASDVAAALLGAELHGFGEEYLANYALRVGKVDVAAAKSAAKEILDPQNYVIVLVGDAKDLEPQLKAEGWRYEKVPFNAPIGTRMVAPGSGPALAEVKVSPAAQAAARKFLDEAVVAKGGLARLRSIVSLVITAAGSATQQGQTIPIEMTRTSALPDKMRMDIVIANQVHINLAVDGSKGWQQSPQGMVEIAPAELDAVQGDLWRDPDLVLLRYLEAGAKVVPLPDEKIAGSTHKVIRVSTADGHRSVTLYLDAKTKLLTRMAYVENGINSLDTFSDYRTVSGVKIAHQRTSEGGGRNTSYAITKIELDGTVDASIFAKPAS